MRGNHGKVGEAPLAAFDFIVFRRADFDEVANRRRDDIIVVLEVLVMLGKAAQRPCDVVRDGRFLGNDQSF